MNRFWSAFLICFVLSACSQSSSSLQLQNLCKEDHFTYNGILVNSLHFGHRNETLPEVGHYAIDPFELCENDKEYPEFNETILSIKNMYNHLVAHVYSDRYLNDEKTNRTRLDAEMKQIDEWIDDLKKIINGRSSFSNCIQEEFINKMDLMKSFFVSLRPFLDGHFPNTDWLFFDYRTNADFRDMKQDILGMFNAVESGQVGAFVKEFEQDVFRKPLLTRPKYEFIRKSKIIYDFDSYLIRNYNVTYPFYEQFDNYKDCLKAADLSPFFADENARKPDD